MASELKIREVERSDKEEIMELASHIWDGRDYIPDYFDRWFEEGGFICGKSGGKIIALAKHTWHRDDVLWLEGLRVHPDHQGQGYGRKMIEGQIDFIEDLDYSVARFLTSGDNTPVIKVAEDIGFELKKKYEYLRLKEKDMERVHTSSEKSEMEASVEKDVDDVIEFVQGSPEFEENAGLYIEHWIGYPLDESLIKDRVEKGRCFSIRDGKDIDSLIFLEVEENYGSLSAAFTCGTVEGIKGLFRFGTERCIRNGHDRFRLKTASDKVVEAAKEIGFTHSDKYRYNLVYEYYKD